MLEQIITNRIHKRGFMSEQKQKTKQTKEEKDRFPTKQKTISPVQCSIITYEIKILPMHRKCRDSWD